MACTPQRSAELAELSGGRLDAGGAAGLLEHLEQCPACSEELDLVADLLRLGRGAPSATRRRTRLRLVVGAALAVAAAWLLVLALVPRANGRRIEHLARLAPPPAAGLVLRGGPEPEDERLAEGLRLLGARDFAGAAERLALVLRSRPDDPLALYSFGLARLQLAVDDEALSALERAAELGEGLLAEQALWYAVNAHLARGEGERARAGLQRLIALDGDYEPNARALLAELERLSR